MNKIWEKVSYGTEPGSRLLMRNQTPSLSYKKQKAIFQRWHKQKISRAQGGLTEFVTTQMSSEIFGFQIGKEKLYCKDIVGMARIFRFSLSEKSNILFYNLMKLDFLSFRHIDLH